ncbi:MAG: class II D-tagatose-bisphosphate aldolase, non-catalytic subunit [Coriobacteriaceae bacterium]|nr:class II D-tagatose-bisphosphate aldolase, non-catalytic subunit [Coriobacteriaceae bacterium]
MNTLQEIVQKNKSGRRVGIFSCCSAHEDVIRAALLKASKTNTPTLIESTSNQVNQDGGYTGMTPADFAAFVKGLADEISVPLSHVILGGDHLGPLPWTDCDEDEAMDHAEELVAACVSAGYSKIHLDTSMRLASDDPDEPFLTETCARRGARLCRVAEEAFVSYWDSHPDAPEPVYVIGSEVPVPGGDFNAQEMGVTSADDAINTIAIYKQAFADEGLSDVFDRVIALVVELGVEFHEFTLDEYNRPRAADLADAMRKEQLCIEGHSTDYQTTRNLAAMCEDGVAILKVGPALTFALREALFALEQIEQEVFAEMPERWSNYRATLEQAMLDDPSAWKDYYTGTPNEQRIARAFSFYDRCRYYFACPEVVQAHDTLVENLSGNIIPHCLLSQYLPLQYYRVRRGEIRNEAADIIWDHIGDCIDGYLQATDYCGVGAFNYEL